MSTADAHSWWDLAACRLEDAELFFPVTETGPARLQVARAKAVCAGCRARQQCLDYALRTRQVHGVWGGMSEADRERLRADAA
jgi:WhiB family transcriptional regulator, redox-sensing transcriptional regulator